MRNAQSTAGADGETRPDGGRAQPRGSILPQLVRAVALVVLVTLLAGYLAREYSARQEAVYEANSRVVLSTASNFSPFGQYFGGTENRYVANQASIMTSLAVLDRAAAILADGTPGTELRGEIEARPAGPSDVITITAQADDGELAARRADAVAVAYGEFTAEQVRLVTEDAVAASAADPFVTSEIRARAATFGDGVQVIEPAEVPSSPASPTPSRNALLAAAAAFLLSAGLAMLWLTWRRPTGRDRLAADVGGPLLGEVPVRWFGSLPVPKQPRIADYGIALQALRYRLRSADSASVLVTGVGRDSSATSAVLGLAAAEAAQGRRVVLVDATQDGRLLRRAGVTAPTNPLTAATTGPGGLDSALVGVPALDGPHGGSVRIARIDRTTVAGAEVLQRALSALLGSSDLVLIDAGAVVRDATAFALLGEVGAVVAVVRTSSRGHELPDLRHQLALAGRTCDGVLLTERTWIPPLKSAVSSATPSEPVAPRKLPPPPPPAAAGEQDPQRSVAAGRPS